jgi:4-hydroxy-tetrahydrodipicolinate synthase
LKYTEQKENTIMNKPTVFTGAATAIITPLTPDGIDFDRYGAMIDWQIEAGIDAIVAVGTTGEGSTLSDEEHRAAIKYCVERVNHRVPVIAGTGSNDTAYSVDLSRYAASVGADAMLLVTPYYNKATQKGMIACSVAVADAIDKPCILYNVPGRTGCNMLPKTVAEMAEHPNIVAIKEASGNMSQIAEIASLVEGKMDIYSGNDDQIVPVLSLGGKGVISVLSNILPAETSLMCKKFFNGDVAGARRMQLDYLELINTLFCEVNPIPVKAASGLMGLCSGELRLPLCDPEPENLAKISAVLKEYGLI